MKRRDIHSLEIHYTTATGLRSIFRARSIETCGTAFLTMHDRDDPSLTIRIPWNDVHEIKKAVVSIVA